MADMLQFPEFHIGTTKTQKLEESISTDKHCTKHLLIIKKDKNRPLA
jgi:hypothetical protein